VAQPTAVQVPAEPDVAVPVHVYGSDAVQMFAIAVGTWKIHSSDQGYGLNKWAGKGNPLHGEQGGLAGCITPSVNPPLHLPAQVPVKVQTPLGLVQEGADGLPV